MEQRPQRKRPRVRLACLTCRERKTRCDGRQPICEACEARGVGDTCSYNLPQRLAPTTTQNEQVISNAEPEIHQQTRLADQSAQRPARFHTDTPKFDVHTNAGDTDALATVPSYSLADSLYGSSSSITFTRHSLPHVEATGNTSLPTRRSGSTEQVKRPDRLWERNDADAMLPHRRVADAYLHCYWNFIHPVFPIVHKPTIIKQYEALWTSSTPALEETEETTFTAMVNLLLALGSKVNDSLPPVKRAEVADGFYQRSRKTYNFDILDSPSLETVQLLLLTGVYLQSSQYAQRCWNAVGLAIRIAQSFGLHTESNFIDVPSQAVLEMRRRIWHNCVCLDR